MGGHAFDYFNRSDPSKQVPLIPLSNDINAEQLKRQADWTSPESLRLFSSVNIPGFAKHAGAGTLTRVSWSLLTPVDGELTTLLDLDNEEHTRVGHQEPGDLLFVPEGWGHATILESYAVPRMCNMCNLPLHVFSSCLQ